MLRLPLSLTFLAVVSTMALESHADETDDATHVHARAGALAFNLGHYAEAVVEYEAAYRAVPDPVFLYNVGQAYRLSGNNEKAVIAYKSYLRTAPWDAPNRAQVERHIAELEPGSLTPDLRARSARLTIEADIEGAEIEIDGRAVGITPLPSPVWVFPGKHRVAMLQANTTIAVEDAEGTPGVTQKVVIHGRSTAEPARSPAIETARGLQASTPPDRGWWLGRKWTWVAAGTTVAFTGTAAVFGLAMRSKFDNLNKSCGSASNSTVACSSNQIDSAVTLKNTANIFWSLAGAAAVTTGVVFFIEGRPTTVTPMAGQATGFLASMRY
jgi:tetratricopeptide (TPR) repeat protein